MMRNDQANRLRNQMNHSKNDPSIAKTISFVSGKGGVGKSNIAINFALELIQANHHVLMIDLDVGMGNIDILLGVQAKHTLVDALEQNLRLEEIVEKGPEGLAYIAGGSSFTRLFTLNDKHMHYFLSEFDILVQKYDYIIFDMGAGITAESLFFILSSDEAILITTPEPTSITDGYSMVKHLTKEAPNMPIHVVMNRSASLKNGTKALHRFDKVVQSFLNRPIHKLAIIPEDKLVREAVMKQQPFTISSKHSQASRAIKKMLYTYLRKSECNTNKSPLSFIQKVKQLWRERST